jgi:hypothetical protein
MITKTISTCAAVMALCLFALAAPMLAQPDDAKPDFSGSWVMAVERSFGQPKDMQQTMTVTQTDDQMTVETKLILPDNERILKDTYMLDGKEHDFTPAAPLNAPPNTPAGKGKRTVTWLANAAGMLVTDVITNETPKGPTILQVARKWTISSDGALTITNFIDAPNGSYETKRVFVKK